MSADLEIVQSSDADQGRLVASVGRARRAWHSLGMRVRSVTPSGIVRFTLVVLALWLVGWILYRAGSTLLPFWIGLFIAYLVLPVVRWADRFLPRTIAALLVFLGTLVLMIVVPAVLLPLVVGQLLDLLGSLPSSEQVSGYVGRLQAWVATLPPQAQEAISNTVQQAATNLRANFVDYMQNMMSFILGTLLGFVNTIAFLIGFLVVPFFLFYVVNDEAKGTRAVDYLLAHWIRDDFWAILRIFDRVFSGYLRGQLILGTVVGTSVFIGLWILRLFGVEGINYPLLLALFAFMTEFIPYIGPTLGAIPGVIMGMFTSWQTALLIAGMYTLVQLLENQLFVPRITGAALNLHPAILMMGLVAMSQFGLIWVILAAPLMALMRELFRYVYGRFEEPPRPAGLLPGEERPVVVETPALAELLPPSDAQAASL